MRTTRAYCQQITAVRGLSVEAGIVAGERQVCELADPRSPWFIGSANLVASDVFPGMPSILTGFLLPLWTVRLLM